MRIVTSNVKCNPKMRQSYVESDIRRVRELGDVIFWQEIEIPRYKDAVKRIVRGFDDRLYTYNLDVEVPITVNLRDFYLLDYGESRLMHRGRALTTPNRYTSAVRTRRVHDDLRVAFMNTHYVSGAWNAKRKLHKQWRQQMWLKHWTGQKQWIHDLLAQGYTVIGGGDFNRVNVPAFHPDQIDLTSSGIDKLFVIPAKGVTAGTHLVSHVRAGLHTDHPAVVGYVRLHKNAKVGA